MRTSGKDSDLALFSVPVIVLTILTVMWFGGPKQTIRALDTSITEVVAWVKGQF